MTTAIRRAHSGSRAKLSIQDEHNPLGMASQKHEDENKLVKYIDENIIGKTSSFLGPFGRRKVIFCDYNGSGRSLQFLEDYIQKEILPTHGGTCSSMSNTSLQSILFKEESRMIIYNSCNCSSEDVVLLGANLSNLVRTLRLRTPVVFVGPSESAATLSPWSDCGSMIVRIPETKEGYLDLNYLEARLQQYSGCGRKLIGCFAAASRVTGILADDVATTLLLHQYGALAIWGCNLSAAARGLDMNPLVPGLEEGGLAASKDAAYFTCAKYIGGVQAPSVIITKKFLFKQNPLFSHDDIQDIAMKEEECGSVEAVRAGLVVQLKDSIGQQSIEIRQDRITRQVLSHIKNLPELILLGNDVPSTRRLPIFSLLVKHPRGTFLHHNFVCAVLNDIFGIQARGGLKSTTNYGQELLGIDDNLAKEYAKLLGDDVYHTELQHNKVTHSYEHLRPGFFRISLPYFISEAELAFVLEALKMVATEAWKILPQYTVNPETAVWTHHTYTLMRDRKSLKSIKYMEGKMNVSERKYSTSGTFPQTYFECLQAARNLFSRARKSAQKYPLTEQFIKFNARADYLRWYMLPKEAHDLLLGSSTNVKNIIPFDPVLYNSGRKSVASLSSGRNSPISVNSPRHFSLSAMDTNELARFGSSYRSSMRETKLIEYPLVKPNAVKLEKVHSSPVKFMVGEPVTPSTYSNVPVSNLIKAENRLSRARCHSLGSDSPPPSLNNTQTKINLATNMNKLNMCNCGSQTDLQSMEELYNSSSFNYMRNASISDCSQIGRSSPAVSISSHNSEDIQAYVKEMTKEIATELKSEIRGVISKVEDVLENTETIDISNMNFNNCHHPLDRNSVSVTDVTEYLMGVSREMASEVKSEIREMVNQVDEMISPDSNGSNINFYLASPVGSRKNSPPESIRRRYRSGSEVILPRSSIAFESRTLKEKSILRKSPTSPGFMLADSSSQDTEQDKCEQSKNLSPAHTLDATTHNTSFNSSETSSPDTIIQVLLPETLPNSQSPHKLSDDDNENSSVDSDYLRLYNKNKTWYHNNSLSSQDSGINMSFHEHDNCHDTVNKRPTSDLPHCKKRKSHPRLKVSCHRQEKSEVPDIIEGVPVCSGEHKTHFNKVTFPDTAVSAHNEYELCEECDPRDDRSTCSTSTSTCSKYNNRTSTSSSLDTSDFSRKSSFNTDSYNSKRSSMNVTTDDCARCSDPSCCQQLDSVTDAPTLSTTCRSRLSSNSSGSSIEYPGDFIFDEDGKWYCPPKGVWKGTVEAVQEFSMIRHQDKILICLSGGMHSLSLLHTLHQYQFYARAKGIHFTIGAITINDGTSNADPLHLMAYCKTLGIKYIYQDNCFGSSSQCGSRRRDKDLCSFTNHWIRRQIYRSANENGYNVIATGQHFDDVAQSFIVSVFQNGRLKTMKAHYLIREQNLRVIRPFIYVRERSLIQFAESCRIPVFNPSQYDNSDGRYSAEHLFINSMENSDNSEAVPDNSEEKIFTSDQEVSSSNKVNRSISAPCGKKDQPNTESSIRTRAISAPSSLPSALLAQQESLQPGLFTSLKLALHPLISARNIEKDLKEYRHRKRSVIQMKNGAPVYNSDEGTDEEPVP